MKIRLLLLSTLLLVCPAQAVYVIFDLGGVLVDPDATAALREMGTQRVACYALTHLSKILVFKKHLHQRFIGFLNHAEPAEVPGQARDPMGLPIPPIMCRYFTGTPDNEIRTKLLYAARSSDYFDSNSEKRLIKAMIHMVFTPEKMIATQKLNPDGVACVQRCIEQGAHVCIHSTWDSQSFELLKQKHPDFFALFEDRIFISGNTGLMKPDQASFRNILTQLGADPADCIFIDDRIENVLAAHACGIRAVLCQQERCWYAPWRSKANFSAVQRYIDASLAAMLSPALI